MAQFPVRVNLRASHWPLLSKNYGRTIIDQRLDNHLQIAARFTGTEYAHNLGVPQAIYMQDVIPFAEGFRSVGYRVGNTTEPEPLNGYRFLPKGDFLTATATILGDGSSVPHVNLGADFSIACVHRQHYTFSPLTQKVYQIDELGAFTDRTTTGCIPWPGILGILEANNFVVAYNKERIYWGGTDTGKELEFEPSLANMAGSAIPLDLKGDIVACFSIDDGFHIYTTRNVIAATYNANSSHCPWRFREIDGADGIWDRNHVAWSNATHTHYVWSRSGLQLLALGQKAENIFPDVSEFLAGKSIEDYVGVQSEPLDIDSAPAWSSETQAMLIEEATQLQTRQVAAIFVKMRFIGNQFLVISYGGLSRNNYEYALVYDIKLARWGKLKKLHQDILELPNTPLLSNFGILLSGGDIESLLWETWDTDRSGVLILGRYQLSRQHTCTIQSIELEQIPKDAQFDAYWLHTTDGITWIEDSIPVNTIKVESARTYRLRVTGLNHGLKLIGNFDLDSTVLTFTNHGTR